MSEEKKAWHQEQIRRFRDKELPIYIIYAGTLEKILKKAVAKYAPLGIVQTRPKSVASFGEKALRKYEKYKNPLERMTDLCGGRVIALTEDHARAVCDFIKSAFVIDLANSLDVGERLGPEQFGYRSVHYVVQLKGDEILGVPVPPEIGGRKAEIQVRTLMQHAWAEISHDRLYKNKIKVPLTLRREAARIAALIEESEECFARLVDGIDRYGAHYNVYLNAAEMDAEMNTLMTILSGESDDAAAAPIALRIAQMARSRGDWETIRDVLERFIDRPGSDAFPALLREAGNALCRIHRESPKSEPYQRGQALLQKALDLNPNDADAAAQLASSWQPVQYKEETSRSLFLKAHMADPGNPYHFMSFLEYEVFCQKNAAMLAPLFTVIKKAIAICEDHVLVGIELPRAWFTQGKLHLLLGEVDASLRAYLHGIGLCAGMQCCLSEEILDNEIESLLRLKPVEKSLPGNNWQRDHLMEMARRLLLIAKSVRYHKGKPLAVLIEIRKESYDTARPVLILTGGCDATVESLMQSYDECLFETIKPFEGVVISGGTMAGIPGLAGAIAERLSKKGFRRFTLIGYRPGKMPDYVQPDRRYDRHCASDATDFSILDALQSWVDLVASGVDPAGVRMIGINGGAIAALEYRLALALGAQVCVVRESGRQADQIIKDPRWSEKTNLMAIPRDPMTMAAFVNTGKASLTPEMLDCAGRVVHDKYREGKTIVPTDPALAPWELLAEDLKESNRMQAAYALHIMRCAGFDIREKPMADIEIFAGFTDAEVERMAEMEHGRWVYERLGSGWMPGPRDKAKKTSPYLISWADLPDDIKQYDREAVKNFPVMFRQLGLEVYRAEVRY